MTQWEGCELEVVSIESTGNLNQRTYCSLSRVPRERFLSKAKSTMPGLPLRPLSMVSPAQEHPEEWWAWDGAGTPLSTRVVQPACRGHRFLLHGVCGLAAHNRALEGTKPLDISLQPTQGEREHQSGRCLQVTERPMQISSARKEAKGCPSWEVQLWTWLLAKAEYVSRFPSLCPAAVHLQQLAVFPAAVRWGRTSNAPWKARAPLFALSEELTLIGQDSVTCPLPTQSPWDRGSLYSDWPGQGHRVFLSLSF